MRQVLKITLVLGLLAGGPAFAQTTAPADGSQSTGATASPMPPQRADSSAPAAVSTADNPRTTAAPVSGANSFTESQARARIEEKGFGNVTELKKDDQGVWRATAMKDGKSLAVALDYQGNVVGQ